MGYCGNNNDNKRFSRTLSIALAYRGENSDRTGIQSTLQTVLLDLAPELKPQVYLARIHSSSVVAEAGFILNIPALPRLLSIESFIFGILNRLSLV